MADLSALFPGLDPGQLQGLLAQFQPSAEDKATARQHAILTASLGLLGARKGYEFDQMGRAGLLGAGQYNDELKQLAAQRGANLSQALNLWKLGKDVQKMQMGMDMVNGTGPYGGGPPAPPSAIQLGQSGAMPSLAPTNANAAALPALQQATAPQMPSGVPPWANPRAEMGAAVLGDKAMADVIHRQYQIEQGPGNTLMRNGQVVGQVIPNAGMVLDGKFTPLPKEATDALVNYTGATTEATEAAKAKFDLVPLPDGHGGTFLMPKTKALQATGGGGAPAPQFNFNLQNQPANEQAAMLRDMANPGANMPRPPTLAPSTTSIPGVGTGQLGHAPSPVDIHAAESAIDTAAQAQRAFTASNIAQGQKQLEDAQAKRPIAIGMLSGLDQLERMDQKGVFNGPAQNKYMTAAVWLNSIFPGLNLDVNKITNSQAYDSAIAQIQRTGLKSFGGRVTNSEFHSVGLSMPDRVSTPDGRAQIRSQLGAMALDELNQVNSAEQYWQGKQNLLGWQPPSTVQPNQYYSSRVQIMGLQPKSGLSATQVSDVKNILRSGNEDAIRKLVINGLLTNGR